MAKKDTIIPTYVPTIKRFETKELDPSTHDPSGRWYIKPSAAAFREPEVTRVHEPHDDGPEIMDEGTATFSGLLAEGDEEVQYLDLEEMPGCIQRSRDRDQPKQPEQVKQGSLPLGHSIFI